MNQKRKVLMLSCGYKDGNGVATVTKELTETLNYRGDYEVDVLTYWPWGNTRPFRFISHNGREDTFRTLDEFLRTTEADQNYDVLQFHNNVFADDYLKLSGSCPLERLLERQRDALKVSLTHSLASKEGIPQHLRTEQQIMSLSDVLVHLTEDQQEEANRTHPKLKEKTVVVGNGTYEPLQIAENEKRAFRQSVAQDHQKIGLYLGRLSPEKGIDELVQSMPFIKAAHPEFKLVIAGNKGDRAEQTVRNQLNQYGYREGVDYQFMGWVTDRKTKQLLIETADMTIMPSHYEHFPMAALESMIVGTPLVITDIPGPRSVFKVRDRSKRLVLPITEVGKPYPIAEAVHYALDHQPEMRTMAARARQEILEHYTWNKIADEYDELFSRALAKKRGTHFTLRTRTSHGMKQKIGVVVPTYNRKELLDANLDSLLHQDYRGEYVVVVVDDGSTDGTFEHILSEYRSHIRTAENQVTGETINGNPEGKLMVIRQENKHISGARNTGLKKLYELGCQYFTHQDSDDVALPSKLRVLSEFLDRNKDVGLVHAKSHTATYEGVLLTSQESPWERCYDSAWWDFGDGKESMWDRAKRGAWKKGQLERDHYIHNHTPMYTRRAIEQLGLDNLYPEGVKYAEDHEFHKKLERVGVQFGFVDDYVAISRWHNVGATAAHDTRTATEVLEQARAETDVMQRGTWYLAARNRAGGQFEHIAGITPEELQHVEFDLRFERNFHRNMGDVRKASLYANLLAHITSSAGDLEEARGIKDAAAFNFAFERNYFESMGWSQDALLRAKQAYMLSPTAESRGALTRLLKR